MTRPSSARGLVRAAAEARRPLAEGGRTTAYRVVNAEGDGLAGITLDWFEGVAVLSFYREVDAAEEAALLDAIEAELSPEALYVKRRPKEARVVATTRKDELAPELPARGAPVPERIAREEGLSFLIRPGQGLSVGLYLDMRETRTWLRGQVAGRTVLNLFAYTCAFGVAARAGGASRALNVDLSRRVLDWGEENARLNGQPVDRRDYLSGDVFDWLGRLAKKGEPFDAVVLDPPSFATSRKTGAFSVASDYDRLTELAAKVTAPGGLVLACCNHAGLAAGRFEALALGGLSKAGRAARVARRLGPSKVDFPVATGKLPALKVLALEVP